LKSVCKCFEILENSAQRTCFRPLSSCSLEKNSSSRCLYPHTLHRKRLPGSYSILFRKVESTFRIRKGPVRYYLFKLHCTITILSGRVQVCLVRISRCEKPTRLPTKRDIKCLVLLNKITIGLSGWDATFPNRTRECVRLTRGTVLCSCSRISVT